MPKTVQIRDLDDAVYAALLGRAAEAGISVPELVRREVTRLAARPTMKQWLDRTGRGGRSEITSAAVLADLDEMRGPWPDADR